MHETAILQIDQAALAMIQALDTYGEEMSPLLDPGYLEALQHQVVNLRRVLLGLEMGLLYQGQDWQVPEELLEQASRELLPVDKAATRLRDAASRGAQE
ncbi:hypothetical protein K2Z83_14695 [Oscillochloris sp. ZM17-4]|uniref:hypothetical protein n=1 Tax=Oscillochloris sp. ZM17-4 TaxID=2866714 RepID=UPI001C72A166|nr:hypothetical protein [Oscillochloris sp. ZM17-4]MBX0328925.1 hypothetical protein [Oscillochloris sp. ZM17-4]